MRAEVWICMEISWQWESPMMLGNFLLKIMEVACESNLAVQ